MKICNTEYKIKTNIFFRLITKKYLFKHYIQLQKSNKKITLRQRILLVLLTGIVYVCILLFLHYAFDYNSMQSIAFLTLFFMLLFGISFPFVLEKMGQKMNSKIKISEMDENQNLIYE